MDSVRRSSSLGWLLLGWSIRALRRSSITSVRYGRPPGRATVSKDATVHLDTHTYTHNK